MKLHHDLSYVDIKDVDKIIISEEMLKQIDMYYSLNQVPNFINFNFKSLNIELILKNKVNIFIENTNKKQATITVFSNEQKLVSFEIEYIFDVFFEVINILEYSEIYKYRESAEELILFALSCYPMILFYIQAHSGGYESKVKRLTFFINLKN